jgi:DNA (cytosine-5)-methyltransferase 1
LDLGLRRAGFTIVLANDINRQCADSHRVNFRDVPFFEGSISDLTQIKAREVSEGGIDQQVDLLAGGPPCPPFSKSRFYRKEKPRALEDPVGSESLTGYLKTLEWLAPRAFLLENVAGLAYKVHKEAFDLIATTAERLGYAISWRILNAANYGVPQIRERFFMIGTRGQRFVWPEPTHTTQQRDDLFSFGKEPWRTAGDAIGDLDSDEMADDDGHFAGGQFHNLLREIPPGDNYLFLTAKRGHPSPRFLWRSRYWSFLLKLSPDLPSWTIQARRSNNMGPFHWRNRILRIEEVKRLQTFPDDWFLAGTIEQQWRQVGNAVPPLLAEALGNSLSSSLVNAESERPINRKPALVSP